MTGGGVTGKPVREVDINLPSACMRAGSDQTGLSGAREWTVPSRR